MSYRIEGWVEVTWCKGAEQEEDYAWQSLLNLGVLIHAPDTVSERLVGLSKRCTAGEIKIHSTAAGRGLPRNPSAEVQRKMDWIKVHEKKNGTGEFGGYTHASWHEIKDARLMDDGFEQSDWRVVFDIIDQLNQHKLYADDQIRFVVWYEW